jgi:hypothetical protein
MKGLESIYSRERTKEMYWFDLREADVDVSECG